MYPAPNTNTPFSTDYRGLLVAKITAVHNPTTGPFAGRPVHEWTEQQITSTGGDEDATPPRKGVYTSALITSNILLDVNDNELVVGQYVWARMKGMTGGIAVYETVSVPTQTSPTSPPLTNCITDFVGILDSACLRAYILAGADPGKCANISAAGPITLQPFGSYVWVADETFPVAGGDALLSVYKDSNGDERGKLSIWTGSGFTELDTGKSAGCVGSYTEIVFPPDDLICDDTGVVCGDNALHVRVACIACPSPDYAGTCDEASCPDGAPGAYTFTLSGGTTDFAGLNGTWAIVYDADAGEWTATRGGWTAVLTLSGTAATLAFTFDAATTPPAVTYTLDPIPADCCADITVAYSSHTGTGTRPTGPTLTNVDACPTCPTVDVPCCTPTLLHTTYNLTFGGALSGLGTTVITWNGTNYVSPTDFGDWCGNSANKVTATVSPTACWTLSFAITGPPVDGSGDTAAESSCDPLAISFAGTTATCGAWTAVVAEIP